MTPTSGPLEVLDIRAMGPRAWLLETDPDHAAALAAHLRAAAADGRVEGIVDVVGGATTVLIVHQGADGDGVLRAVLGVAATASSSHSISDGMSLGPARAVTIDVDYDGPDLVTVARQVGLEPAEVIALHTGTTYTVAFCGFLPGFAYLTGLPPRLHLPRRATPRPRLAAGSVAIAGPYSGVYPVESPGGWHLLGTTDAVLWDEHRDDPALLPPGTTVRFRPR